MTASRWELFGDWSLRECTLVVSGIGTTDSYCVCEDCGGAESLTLELGLDREDVRRIRDQLSAWLERGDCRTVAG